MYTFDENNPEPETGNKARNVLIAIFLGLLLFIVVVKYGISSDTSANTSARQSSGRSSTLRELHNDCGKCGTNSPVGGWQGEGRLLLLDEDKTFITQLEDDSIVTGRWGQLNDELCLTPENGDLTCLAYEQKLDAMKLGDALYIRR